MGDRGANAAGAAARITPRRRVKRFPALARFALALVLWGPAVALWARSGFAVPPIAFMASPRPMVMGLAATAFYGLIGLAITLRRPEVRTGRLLAWAAAVQGLLDLTWAYLALAKSTIVTLPIDPAVAAWVSYAVAMPVAAVLIIPLAAIFPTDRIESRAGRRSVALAGAAAALILMGSLLKPGPMPFIVGYQSPFGSAPTASIGSAIQFLGYALLASASVMVAYSQLIRYRHADAVMRAQLRVFAGTATLSAATFVALIGTTLAELGTPALRDLVGVAHEVGIALIPLAVFAAIARYRLYQIDRLVSRGFVYGVLMAIAGGLTSASIQALTALFKSVAGGPSDAVLVFTTLILVSVFAPIKARLEKIAKHVTQVPTAPGVGAVEGAAATEDIARPREFDDPAFLAAFDARARAILAAELGRRDEGGASPSAP